MNEMFADVNDVLAGLVQGGSVRGAFIEGAAASGYPFMERVGQYFDTASDPTNPYIIEQRLTPLGREVFADWLDNPPEYAAYAASARNATPVPDSTWRGALPVDLAGGVNGGILLLIAAALAAAVAFGGRR